VSGHIVLGLDEVLLDLEGEGYSTRAFVIPASAVDANHKRERVWIVAYSNSRRYRIKEKKVFSGRNTFVDGSTDVANTDSDARGNTKGSGEAKRELQSQEQEGSTMGSEVTGCGGLRGEAEGSIERRLGGVVDGIPSWMDEPDIPRVTTNQAGRTQRLKMIGNAVVPQVVYQLGLAMKELWDEV
jgi:DNA (cytosine-5)-methyltransferase 1